MHTHRAGLAATAGLALCMPALTGCGTSWAASTDDSRVQVATSFYPVTYAVQQVGGDHVQTTTLTPPGAEPHDLQLTPHDLRAVSDADLVAYAKGFQVAVDEVVTQDAPDKALNLAPAAHLDLTFETSVDGTVGDVSTSQHDHGDEHEDAPTEDQHPTDEHAHAEGHDHQHGVDPHFWLDPVRYAKVAQQIASRLEAIDPQHRSDYRANLKAFTTRLHTLDTDYSRTLRSCDHRTLVTSHTAFGYLAERYDLRQIGVSGFSPEQMPTPDRMQTVSDYVKAHHVSTIYAETLVSPAVAETVARETGAHLAILDPIEGITKDSAGKDYFAVMRANLRTLQKGQGCR